MRSPFEFKTYVKNQFQSVFVPEGGAKVKWKFTNSFCNSSNKLFGFCALLFRMLFLLLMLPIESPIFATSLRAKYNIRTKIGIRPLFNQISALFFYTANINKSNRIDLDTILCIGRFFRSSSTTYFTIHFYLALVAHITKPHKFSCVIRLVWFFCCFIILYRLVFCVVLVFYSFSDRIRCNIFYIWFPVLQIERSRMVTN